MSTPDFENARIELLKLPEQTDDMWLLSIREQPQSPACGIRLSHAGLTEVIEWLQECVVETETNFDDDHDGGRRIPESTRNASD